MNNDNESSEKKITNDKVDKVNKEIDPEAKKRREEALIKALTVIENRVEENNMSKLDRCLIF